MVMLHFVYLILSEIRLASRCLVGVQLRRWQGDGESLPIPVIDPPDGFDAVIEDRYAVVSQHYHDVLIFEGGRTSVRLQGCGFAVLARASERPATVHRLFTTRVASVSPRDS